MYLMYLMFDLIHYFQQLLLNHLYQLNLKYLRLHLMPKHLLLLLNLKYLLNLKNLKYHLRHLLLNFQHYLMNRLNL
jgi:hypothetical protein